MRGGAIDLIDKPDFYLGERSESKVPDFDRRVRLCFALAVLRGPEKEAESFPHYLLIRVDPPIPLDTGNEVTEVVIRERYLGDDLLKLESGFMVIHLLEIQDRSNLRGDLIDSGALRDWGIAEIARDPSDLPPSQEDTFEMCFALLKHFADREGHTEVPEYHREQGVPLGVWVANMRASRAYGSFRQEWATRMESLPGWRWLPGDDFFLLESYARREGHTDVPADYREEGRPLGLFVSQKRDQYRRGYLADVEIEKLEAIPYWHW